MIAGVAIATLGLLISQVNPTGELGRVDLIGKVDLIGESGRIDLIGDVDL